MDVRVRLQSLFAPALVVSFAVAASVIASTHVASKAYVRRATAAAEQYRTINVKGSVRERITSDQAVWRIRVSGLAPDLQAAYAVVERGVEQVQAFLKEQEFRSEEVGLGAISTNTYYATDEKGRQTRSVQEYELSRWFMVTTTDVQRINRSAGEVTRLIREGVRVESYAPEYYYSKLAELKVELIGKAAADARARADSIARAAGARVTEVRDAQTGVMQITRPHSTETSYEGMFDTSTIEKDVTVVITLTLGIEAG
ncbi:MAG: SIMPL domain-containing protein [Phycisphaerae bacterium]|nr:SIMPL domain-containing protein [Phycisphaerae bacterium]